jgi:hypothetical protein
VSGRSELLSCFVELHTAKETLMREGPRKSTAAYEAPELVELGALQELTLFCNKTTGGSDGFTFQSQAIVCSSG